LEEDGELRETLTSRWQRLQADRARIDEAESAVIQSALEESGGVISRAARLLGLARTTFGSRLEMLGVRAKTKGDE
jgi:transcriptional regulator with GAF, ATPase, and Fis domain